MDVQCAHAVNTTGNLDGIFRDGQRKNEVFSGSAQEEQDSRMKGGPCSEATDFTDGPDGFSPFVADCGFQAGQGRDVRRASH